MSNIIPLRKFMDTHDMLSTLQMYNVPFNVFDGYCKAYSVLSKPQYRDILVSVSGGVDSDIVLDIVWRIDRDNRCRYVYFNTGMEYRATIRHLVYLQDRYGIKIETYRPKESVPVACKKYGLPIFSKFAAEQIGRLQNLGFNFSDGGRPYEELVERYGIETDNSNLPGVERVGNRYYKSVSPIRWWCNKYTANGFNIDRKRHLKEFMIKNPPQFSISSTCCDKAKKSIAHEILNSEWVDLNITGIRKAEGGIRSMSYRTCFNFGGEDKADLYMPVFWYTDADKKAYEEIFDIKHSDCYTVYGFRRTGCAACPFGGIKHCNKELIAIKEKEPNLYRAAHFVFDKSYKYMREFENYRRMIKRRGK